MRFLLLLLNLWLSGVFSEYCYYRRGENSSYLDCEYLYADEPIEGISLIHLEYNTSIPVIEKTLLSSFKNLKTLYLTAANIQKIDPEAFKNHSLEMVDLYHNKLEAIEKGTFAGQKNLIYLDLSFNAFSNVSSSTLFGLVALEWLSLNSNHLRKIDSTTFDDTQKLKALFLRYNLLSSLDANVFKKLTDLETLDLCANLLTTIPSGLFSSQLHLNTLMLQFNRLESFANNTFDTNSELRWMDVSYNFLTKLSEDLFLHTNKLETLRLNNNNISEFNTTVLFSYVPMLREFNFFNLVGQEDT